MRRAGQILFLIGIILIGLHAHIGKWAVAVLKPPMPAHVVYSPTDHPAVLYGLRAAIVGVGLCGLATVLGIVSVFLRPKDE
jgi:hypothetical protein